MEKDKIIQETMVTNCKVTMCLADDAVSRTLTKGCFHCPFTKRIH